MSLELEVMSLMKDAMKNKDEAMLRGLRAIKAEIIKAKTEPGANGAISEDGEMKLLQKLVKQRKDSLTIFQEQNRTDLAEKEAEEIAVIEKFLPVQMTEEAVKTAVDAIVKELGATGPQDLGKVMGVASKQLAGKADGKIIAAIAKNALTN
ncbi:MAG: GatB/YqeY domain-containing protein [Chitinophagia bacterium]